jgi:citrate synthase
MAKITIELSGLAWDNKTQEIVDAVIAAHATAARNNPNASTGGAVNAFHGSASFRQAVVGGIMTLGRNHGPIGDARVVFEHWTDADFEAVAEHDGLVPGFGNSFFRNQIDPAWGKVRDLIESKWPTEWARLMTLSKHVPVAPNAAMFTAIACGAAKIPHGYEELLFILPRIPVWAEKCQQHTQ